MSGFTQDEAARLFQQYGDATTPTLYYANGSDADVFNTSSDEFGNYSTGASVNDTRITNPWDPSLPENRGGYSGYKYPIDARNSQPLLPEATPWLMYASVGLFALATIWVLTRKQ